MLFRSNFLGFCSVNGFIFIIHFISLHWNECYKSLRPLSNGKQIDPGKSVQFKQGGDHGMLMGLKAPLLIGDKFEASLVFENAGTANVEFWAESGPESSDSHANH